MIHEVVKLRTAQFLDGCGYPEAQAVSFARNPGWVFVDDPVAPRAALIWADGTEGLYLVGDAGQGAFAHQLDRHMRDVVEPRMKELGLEWCEISGDEGWEPVLESLLERRAPVRSTQCVYLPGPKQGREAAAPVNASEKDEHRVLRICSELLGTLDAGNSEFLFAKLCRFWDSVGAFLRHGIGYLTLEDSTVASVCFSGFVHGDVHVVDVETVPARRREGCGRACARAFLDECYDRGFRPHWDCMQENEGSRRLAESLGLKLSRTYTLYSFRLV